MITRERARQAGIEGWSNRHDDEHTDGSLAIVAALYATVGTGTSLVWPGNTAREAWPDSWDKGYDKRRHHPRIKQLAIAGALIAAEIDRLQRAGMADEKRERAENRARVAQSHDL